MAMEFIPGDEGEMIIQLDEHDTRILTAADGVRLQVDDALDRLGKQIDLGTKRTYNVRVIDANGRERARRGNIEYLQKMAKKG